MDLDIKHIYYIVYTAQRGREILAMTCLVSSSRTLLPNPRFLVKAHDDVGVCYIYELKRLQ